VSDSAPSSRSFSRFWREEDDSIPANRSRLENHSVDRENKGEGVTSQRT